MSESDQTPDSKKHWDLLFRLECGIRYCERRHAFFANCNRLLLVVGLLGYTLDAVLSTHVLDGLFPGLVALAFVLGVGFETTAKAFSYREFKQRFCNVEIMLRTSELTPEVLRQTKQDILRIEMDEPPVMHALYALCYNEAARALGVSREHWIEVKWWERYTAQFFAWADSKTLDAARLLDREA